MKAFSYQAQLGLAIVVAIVLGYFAYASVIGLQRRPGYTVYVEFADARGISRGTSVTRAGTDVGWVKDVRLDPDRGIARATVKIRPGVTFPKDAVFCVSSQGLIEERYLSIQNNPKPNPLLGDAEEGDVFPGHVEAGFSDLITSANQALVQVNRLLAVAEDFTSEEKLGGAIRDLLAKLDDTISSAGAVLERVDRVLAASQGEVSATLSNIRELTGNLSAASEVVSTAVEQAELPKRLSTALDEIDQTMELMNQIAADVAEITGDPQVKQNIRESIGLTRDTLNEAKETMEALRGTLSKVNEKVDSFGKFGVQGKVNLRHESVHANKKSDNEYVDVKGRLRVGDNVVEVGVDNVGARGEDSGLSLQAGRYLSTSLLVRGGIYRQQAGVGFNLVGSRGWEFTADAFNINNPQLNSYLSVPIARRLSLLLGVEDIGDRDEYNAGIQLTF
ncbi:MAG: hypothetical protein B1H03_03280 [Planctomycetales bacterium 4484_113]|nr:MAG: hypothetical protein B1H03_03280 [Planctomycetales bacterium 4484_113]